MRRAEIEQQTYKYLKRDITPKLEDPSTVMYELHDVMNAATYDLLEYGTLIQDNTFANNYSGMKGSALLIERISEV